MGGLHIEMALLSILGQVLEGSGWRTVMDKANVTTEGRAVGIEKGSSTSRGQWAHQVTLAALSVLKQKAYKDYLVSKVNCEFLSFKEWSCAMSAKHPQFFYWNLVIKFESLLMKFLEAQREANYDMYINSLAEIVPWMFYFNHYHYARWMTVYLNDVHMLKESIDKKGKSNDNHHEQIPSVQKHFLADVRNTLSLFERLGDTFKEDSNKLYTVHTKVVVPQDIVDLRKKKQ